MDSSLILLDGSVPEQPSTLTDDRFHPDKLRLPQTFIGGSVKKLTTTVDVGKSTRFEYVRVHPDPEYRVDTLVLEHERVSYLIEPGLREHILPDLVARTLYASITRHGRLFVWPVSVRTESSRPNAWSESAEAAIKEAMQGWVRVASNLQIGQYETFRPIVNDLPEPEWPNLTFQQWLTIAFKHRYIENMNHPVLRTIRGEI